MLRSRHCEWGAEKGSRRRHRANKWADTARRTEGSWSPAVPWEDRRPSSIAGKFPCCLMNDYAPCSSGCPLFKTHLMSAATYFGVFLWCWIGNDDTDHICRECRSLWKHGPRILSKVLQLLFRRIILKKEASWFKNICTQWQNWLYIEDRQILAAFIAVFFQGWAFLAFYKVVQYHLTVQCCTTLIKCLFCYLLPSIMAIVITGLGLDVYSFDSWMTKIPHNGLQSFLRACLTLWSHARLAEQTLHSLFLCARFGRQGPAVQSNCYFFSGLSPKASNWALLWHMSHAWTCNLQEQNLEPAFKTCKYSIGNPSIST